MLRNAHIENWIDRRVFLSAPIQRRGRNVRRTVLTSFQDPYTFGPSRPHLTPYHFGFAGRPERPIKPSQEIQ